MSAGAPVEGFSPEAVQRIALLARLELSADEAARAAGQLSAVVRHINKLAELDLEGVPPMRHPIPLADVTREDEPAPSLPRELALANAPEAEDGCFRVPQII